MKKVFDVFKTVPGLKKNRDWFSTTQDHQTKKKKFNFRFEIAATRRVGRTLPYRG